MFNVRDMSDNMLQTMAYEYNSWVENGHIEEDALLRKVSAEPVVVNMIGTALNVFREMSRRGLKW